MPFQQYVGCACMILSRYLAVRIVTPSLFLYENCSDLEVNMFLWKSKSRDLLKTSD